MGNDSTPKPLLEILYDGYYYDVTDWVKRHPGGKIIEFFTEKGEDASIGIKQFHHRAWDRVVGIMKTLKKRPALDVQTAGTVDPVAKAAALKHTAMTDDYMALYKELLDEGYFKHSRTHAFLRFLEIFLLVTVSTYFIISRNPYLFFPGMVLISLNCTRNAYLVHESGHRSLTGNLKFDKVVEMIAAGFFNGMSAASWNSQHNRHHAFPQREQHDIDLETLPLIAFNKKVVKNEKTAKSFFIQNQAFLFLTVDTWLVAILWRLYLHPRYALHKKMYKELVFILAHNIYVYFIGLFPYLLCVWMTSVHLFGNFALSHSHMAVTSANKIKHWVEYSFDHTINIHPNHFCDWWMGYLNYQIEHHLFPGIPHFRLRKVTGRVKAFAERHGLPYRCVSYWEAVRLNLQNLHKVSKQVKAE